MSMTILSLVVERRDAPFDIYDALCDALYSNGLELCDGDIVVISTKYTSYAQGRIICTDTIRPSDAATSIATRYHLSPKLSEAILRESESVLGGVVGFVLAFGNYMVAPNAGIDRSNTTKNRLILYPTDPYGIAEQIRRKIFLDRCIHVGIILVDSRLGPARVGTTGVAVSCAGIEPVVDVRGHLDLDGNPLKVTFQATSDSLATIANHQMGEGAESKPIVIIRGANVRLTDRIITPIETAVPPDWCVYIRGLSHI